MTKENKGIFMRIKLTKTGGPVTLLLGIFHSWNGDRSCRRLRKNLFHGSHIILYAFTGSNIKTMKQHKPLRKGENLNSRTPKLITTTMQAIVMPTIAPAENEESESETSQNQNVLLDIVCFTGYKVYKMVSLSVHACCHWCTSICKMLFVVPNLLKVCAVMHRCSILDSTRLQIHYEHAQNTLTICNNFDFTCLWFLPLKCDFYAREQNYLL